MNGQKTVACMTPVTNYDRAEDHFPQTFAHGLPLEQAYVHIGLYLGWMIENHLCSEWFSDEASTEIFRFRREEISCGLLSAIWNGVLTSELFSDEGNQFTRHYYGMAGNGGFFHDCNEVFGSAFPSRYHVPDTREVYRMIGHRIKQRYAEWCATAAFHQP